MNLVAPIVFFAIAMGMFCKRWGRNEFIVLSVWIVMVLVRFWIKGAALAETETGTKTPSKMRGPLIGALGAAAVGVLCYAGARYALNDPTLRPPLRDAYHAVRDNAPGMGVSGGAEAASYPLGTGGSADADLRGQVGGGLVGLVVGVAQNRGRGADEKRRRTPG